jgi:hypothetical protein
LLQLDPDCPTLIVRARTFEAPTPHAFLVTFLSGWYRAVDRRTTPIAGTAAARQKQKTSHVVRVAQCQHAVPAGRNDDRRRLHIPLARSIRRAARVPVPRDVDAGIGIVGQS